ncbi:hypothetical protein TSUD_303460 [Trifolium subterraneum]|uniref:Transposase (putative) gypsy type domain-containing protein n=1 Tax=Trifolium subterraneum TaxID=3900 RepID=A0A2Z6MBL7_TRISU|nr:hypothetical protein TSUD_303460 [Trifolium subterraneum]
MAVGKRLWSRDEHLMLIIPMLGVTNLRGDVRCSTVKRYWTLPWALLDGPIEEANGVEGLKFPFGVEYNMMSRRLHLWVYELCSAEMDPSIYCESANLATMEMDPSIYCESANLTTNPAHYQPVQDFRRDFLGFRRGLRGCDLKGQAASSFPATSFGLRQWSRFGWRPKLRAGLFSFRIRVVLLTVVEVCIMADEEVQWKIPVEDNIDWVVDDPRTTPSKFEFEEHFPEDLFTEIEDPGHANWEVRIPGARQRICSSFKNGGFPVYQIIFEHMGLRLPFSDLEVAVFNHLELCPSQLHPNSLAFIRAFEIVVAYLQLAPTVPLFFHIFGIQRSRPRGNVTDKCGWVSLKQHKKYFEIFEESLRGFKDKWFVVRPITFVGWKTIIVRGPKLDDEGRVEHRDDGEHIEVDCERFPFCWSMKHYAREAKSFTFRKGALSKEELADLKVLEEFVEEFPPSLWEDREGNLICDEEGYQLLSKKFINTKALLKCSTRTEAEDLLREMKNTQVTLRKLQAEKKKRQLGASSSTPNVYGQSSPTPSIEVTGARRVTEEVLKYKSFEILSNLQKVTKILFLPEVADDQRPPKHARVEGGGSVVPGLLKPVPGRLAAEFVIPLAMGRECILDGKTKMRISDADQSILASMGPESVRNVVAESSVAFFKLLEVATFLNGRECKYLQERDEARAHAKEFGERLSVLEIDLSSETKALKESQGRVAQLEEDLKSARKNEETLKGQVAELEKKLASMTLSPVDEEEKRLDPSGTYAKFSRADLISKIYQIGDLQLDVASSSFWNTVSQLQILNPGIQLITEGMDEMKKVRDSQIASPPLDEED